MPVRPKVTPCTHCRQMKLRCDSRERFPRPCSRCSKNNLGCSVDPFFKREARRKRIIALEKEIQEIKSSANISNHNVSPIEHDDTQSPSLPYSEIPEVQNLVTTAFSEHDFQTQTLDGIEIQPDEIMVLVGRYYSEYHHHFPILSDITTFSKSYDCCPLLFWTIIAIASKYSPRFSTLYLPLSSLVPRLVVDINIPANRSLNTIQALLLLCWWPFPFQATINDPSWTYCGLACHRALQIGIHRALYHSDFFYDGKLEQNAITERHRTWLGCYITNQILSTHLGIPSTIQPDSIIVAAMGSRPEWLPIVLEHHLKIAYNSQKICHTLGDYSISSSGLHPNPSTMIPLFESQLRVLEAQIRPHWSNLTELAFWRTEIQLCSFALPRKTFTTGDESISDISVFDALARGCLAATSLIHAATSFPDPHIAWTNVVRIAVGYAVFFLLKASSRPELRIVDPITARNSISEAWGFLHHGSEMEGDHFNRVCAIIEYLSKTGGEDRKGELALIVQSRMSANVLWDCAWRAKDRFSQSVKESKPEDYTTAAAVESIIQMGMDFDMAPYFMDQIESFLL